MLDLPCENEEAALPRPEQDLCGAVRRRCGMSEFASRSKAKDL